jgi:ribosome biogenesis GTPase / thiamine phosphate phosphatase
LTLEELGWSAFFADAFEPYRREDTVPARVAVRHHGPCELFTEHGPLGGVPMGRLDDSELPAVGDWVVARTLPGERRALIEAVLPRRTSFKRQEAGKRSVEQVVAANVDTVFLVTAFAHDLNVRRMERYLTAAWESGAEPAIVLNKADLSADPAAEAAAIEGIAFGVPVHLVCATTGDGLDALEGYFGRGRTVALLGSSGVGKSTLVNRFAGERVMKVRDLRQDGRGRHTTTHRELVPLPGGGLLLDTPGMRELQLWAGEEALDSAFDDVTSLFGDCRFNDCAHEREPGCAVQGALRDGALSRERYDSWRKLQRELRRLEIRQDGRLKAEARREVRRFSRNIKHMKKVRADGR